MHDMRESSSEDAVRDTYISRANRFYMRDVPLFGDHKWLRRQGTITTVAAYQTGSLAVSAGGTALTGTDTVWTAAMTGMKIWISGNDEIYDFTRTGATTGTISPAFTGDTALSGAAYVIFQDRYDLASDFLRVTDEPGFYYFMSNGAYHPLRQIDEIYWRQRYTVQPSDPSNWWREFPNRAVDGTQQVQITPPPSKVRILNYEYLKALKYMYEIRTGTVTTVAGNANVTLSSDLSSMITAGMYFQVKGKEFVRVQSVAGATVTLVSGYPSSNTGSDYRISDVPEMQYEAQGVIHAGTCFITALEQESNSLQYWAGRVGNQVQQIFGIEARKRWGRQYLKRIDYRDTWASR